MTFLETVGEATLSKLESGKYFSTLVLPALFNEWVGESHS